MIEKSVLRNFKLRTSNLCFLIPLFYFSHYFIGFTEGQLNRHFRNLKTVELKEIDLGEHEKRYGIQLSQKDREAIRKYAGFRTTLRFVSNWNSFSRTPVHVGTLNPKED